jgi:hypothetical protein
MCIAHKAQMETLIHLLKVPVGKLHGERPLIRRRREDNIKMDCKTKGWGCGLYLSG